MTAVDGVLAFGAIAWFIFAAYWSAIIGADLLHKLGQWSRARRRGRK